MSQREFLTNIAIFVGGCTLLTIAVALIVGLGACSSEQNGPTGPTSVFEGSNQDVPNTGLDVPNTGPDGPSAQQAEGDLVILGNYGICDFSKSYGKVESLAVYRVMENGGQAKIAFYKNPAEGNLQCGVLIQADCLINYNSQPEAGDINAYALADFFIGTLECRTPPRNPPPPPPECDREKLVDNANEECGESGFSVDLEQCSFSCIPPPPTCETDPSLCPPPPPCEPIGEPENECQDWDYDSCSWVGECPPPECQEGEVLVGDQCVPFCTAYPGDPTCAPSCEFGDAVWNGQTWECPPPPPCEPTGEPLCDGQTWSTESCSWVGECGEGCLYEVAGASFLKQFICQIHGGDWGLHDQGSFHCGFDLPGICHNSFNLSPGISHPECLTKHDCD